MEPFVFVDKDRIKLDSSVKVVKASSYTQIVAAETALIEAKRRADQMVIEAQQKAEEITAAAEEVYATEKERGYQEGLQAAKQEMATHMSRMANKTSSFFHAIEEKLASLVIDTVKKVIGRMDQNDLIRSLVKQALSVFRNQKQIILKVSPVQRDLLIDELSEILMHYPHINTIEVIGEERLKPGEVIMETPIGIVDASIKTQVAAIRQAFSDSFKNP